MALFHKPYKSATHACYIFSLGVIVFRLGVSLTQIGLYSAIGRYPSHVGPGAADKAPVHEGGPGPATLHGPTAVVPYLGGDSRTASRVS